jgi:hypothetical protein
MSLSPGLQQRLLPVGACAAILAMIVLRQTLEQSMALHMLLQLPVLVGAGLALAHALPESVRARVASYDEHGIAGLFAIMFLSAYWMIPRALESVLTSPLAELAKFSTCVLAGVLLPGILARADRITQIFFLGNFASMMAITGMLYQDSSQRLCNYYLLDDQLVAGSGMVIYAIAAVLAWLVYQWVKALPANPR